MISRDIRRELTKARERNADLGRDTFEKRSLHDASVALGDPQMAHIKIHKQCHALSLARLLAPVQKIYLHV